MTKAGTRLNQLLKLAINPTTPVEEARNSALAACRLIDKYNLVTIGTQESYNSGWQLGYKAGYAKGLEEGKKVVKPISVPKPKRRIIEARFDGRCQFCDKSYYIGDQIAWGKNMGTTCLKCRDKGQLELVDDFD